MTENKISAPEKMERGLDMMKSDVDVGLGVYEGFQVTHAADTVNKHALLWKIDLRWIPLVFVLLALCFKLSEHADPK